MSAIQEFYRDKCVLITGSSGFMGKLLLEKLLRSCPDVGTIYLLLRPKKGESSARRVEKLLQESIFERLRKERGLNLVTHPCIHAISGDIQRPGLGISSAERNVLLSNVNLVFHVAASVRFNEKLQSALHTNLAGTQSILQLCREMQHLKALIYVSTAYSNSPRNQIDEVVYNPPVDPEKLLQCVEWMSEDQLEDLAPSMLGDWPNTYTFSKMLAENLVLKYNNTMPISIFRPSIVIATNREPIPGWLDNLNGPAGITVGSEMGTIRCMRCDSDLKVDLVPVDMAINAMLVAAWNTALQYRQGETQVFNFVSSAQRPITWMEYTRICSAYARKHPPEKAMWYYCLMLIKNPILYRFMTILTHDIPAQLLDIVPTILGKPARMTKLYGKIAQFTDVLSYFTTREWQFSDNNVKELFARLNETDKAIFPFDLSALNWETYLNEYMAGIRVHLLKENPDNLPVARKKYFLLYLLHRGLQITLAYGGFRFIMFLSSYILRIRRTRMEVTSIL